MLTNVSNFFIVLLSWPTGSDMREFMYVYGVADEYGNILQATTNELELGARLPVAQILKMTLKSSIKTVTLYH